jgi:hypothetical protein
MGIPTPHTLTDTSYDWSGLFNLNGSISCWLIRSSILHVVICHLCVFGKMSIQTFYYFFKMFLLVYDRDTGSL